MNKQMFWQFCNIHAQNSLFITMLYTMEYSLPYDILSDDILLLSLWIKNVTPDSEPAWRVIYNNDTPKLEFSISLFIKK